MRTSCVYFITGGGMTKVGVSARPAFRLAELQRHSPVALALVFQTGGDRGLERQIHARLADRRAHGEWFHGEMTEAEARRTAADAKQAAEQSGRSKRWTSNKLAPRTREAIALTHRDKADLEARELLDELPYMRRAEAVAAAQKFLTIHRRRYMTPSFKSAVRSYANANTDA